MEKTVKKNVQDEMLEKAKGKSITIYTMNGFQMRGVTLLDYDSYSIVVMNEEKKSMIYKHAISTIEF